MSRPRCRLPMRVAWIVGSAHCALGLFSACADPRPRSGDAGPADADAAAPADAAGAPDAGVEMPLPPGPCASPVPYVDVSEPDAVVGDGAPASCTEAALDTALAGGGVVVFDCGASFTTIDITSEKRITRDTVIDGGGAVTLRGAGGGRLLVVDGASGEGAPALTVQRLRLREGRGADGGAILARSGRLTVIDSAFEDNGADTTAVGGAILALGGGPSTIVASAFVDNQAASGGAIGVADGALVVVNSMIQRNTATGAGGAIGTGGEGGGIYITGGGDEVRLCGVDVSDNRAGAFGGGVFQESMDGQGRVVIERARVDGNRAPDVMPSRAGGLFLLGAPVTIEGTTVSNNEARSDGGLFIGAGASIEMVNTTVAQNTALSSLTGGLSLADGVPGTIRNSTFGANRAPGALAVAGAIVGGTNVLLANTIVWGSEAGNPIGPISCRDVMMEGGGNLQWPMEPADNANSDTDPPCSAEVVFGDAALGPLGDHGGPTPTMVPAPGSPAIGLGADCPATDQRGRPRPAACTAGAVEVTPEDGAPGRGRGERPRRGPRERRPGRGGGDDGSGRELGPARDR